MKTLKLEDCRRFDSGLKVIGMTNTIEWQIGEYITENDVRQILTRHGQQTVKVEIKPKGNK